MGIVLIGGTLFLVALIWQAVSKPSGPSAAISTCQDSVVDLSARGEVSRYFVEGRQLFAVIQHPGKPDHVVVIDHCTGDIQRVLTVQDGTGQ